MQEEKKEWLSITASAHAFAEENKRLKLELKSAQGRFSEVYQTIKDHEADIHGVGVPALPATSAQGISAGSNALYDAAIAAAEDDELTSSDDEESAESEPGKQNDAGVQADRGLQADTGIPTEAIVRTDTGVQAETVADDAADAEGEVRADNKGSTESAAAVQAEADIQTEAVTDGAVNACDQTATDQLQLVVYERPKPTPPPTPKYVDASTQAHLGGLGTKGAKDTNPSKWVRTEPYSYKDKSTQVSGVTTADKSTGVYIPSFDKGTQAEPAGIPQSTTHATVCCLLLVLSFLFYMCLARPTDLPMWVAQNQIMVLRQERMLLSAWQEGRMDWLLHRMFDLDKSVLG